MKTKIFNFKVKWLLVPLVLMFACGSAWADYTVTFKTVSTEETSTPTINKSNIIYSGGDYVNSISGASIFRSTSANGLKFGSNKNAGNVVLTMTSTGTIGQIQAAAIKFNGAKKTNGNLKYTITYTDNNTTTGTQTLTTTATDYTIDLTSTKTIKSVKIENTGTKAQFYVKGFTVLVGYNISYDCDGASSGCPSNLTHQLKLPNPLPSAPTKSGYTFDGWYTNSSKTTVAVAGAAITANTTLYAKWVASASVSSISVKTAPDKVVYLAGEKFDPTGLVITATYTNSTTEDITYAGHTSDFTFSPTTSTALTKSNTSVTITYGGKSTTQSITVYDVTLQALDENGDAIRSGGPAAPTLSGIRVTKAANSDNYVFKEWVVSGAILTNVNTNSKDITSPTGDVTVTVKYYKPRTVTWMVNKEPWTPGSGGGSGTDGTPEVARGDKWNTLTLPTEPDPENDGCGEKFIGWTNAEISGKYVKGDDDTAISTLYDSKLLNEDNKSSKTTNSYSINSNIVFHAVFVDYVTE